MKVNLVPIQLLAILVSLNAALAVDAAEKRHADGHVHGIAEVNIAVEGKKIVIELRTPTEGIMGFEHEAKTDAEKKARDAALRTLESRFADLVILDQKLGCTSQPAKVRIVHAEKRDEKGKKHGHSGDKKSGEHREARAAFEYECQQNPAGSSVHFGVTKLFPEIHELKVQVLSDAKQSGATIKKDKGEVKL